MGPNKNKKNRFEKYVHKKSLAVAMRDEGEHEIENNMALNFHFMLIDVVVSLYHAKTVNERIKLTEEK